MRELSVDRAENGLVTSHRRIALPESGAAYDCHEVLHPHFRVRVARAERVTVDEILVFGDTSTPRLGWTGPALRPRLLVVLEGRAEVRVRTKVHVLETGDMLLARHLGDVTKRLVTSTGTMLACDWDLGSLGTGVCEDVTVGRLAPRDLHALRESADLLCRRPDGSGKDRALVSWLTTMLANLRVAGVPFDAPDARGWNDVPAVRAQKIMNALDAALSTLAAQPMTVDLESATGRSRWQVQRGVEEVAQTYALNGSTWRELRQRWRLGVGSFLMTAPGATTSRIAQALGYGSPIALCRAFSDAGLPSPGEVRRLAARDD